MNSGLNGLLQKYGLVSAVYFVLAIIFLNAVFSVFFRDYIVDNANRKEQVLQASHALEFMNKYVNLADLGLRGYIIDQDDRFLSPYSEAMEQYQDNLDELRDVLGQLGYDVKKMDKAEIAIQGYMGLVRDMVKMCQQGEVEEAISILRNDPGYDAWKIYSVFESDALNHIDEVVAEVESNFQVSTMRTLIIQVLFFIVSAPVLILTVRVYKKNRRTRERLFQTLSESNRKYIFDAGEEESEIEDESSVINTITRNLKQAAQFIGEITKGNYDIDWNGMNESNQKHNKENIAGELLMMRDQMKKVKIEDDKRIWISQGLSDFADIIRRNQHDFKLLSEELITNIVKYLKVQMGGLFIVNREDETDITLDLMGCYAYERLKTIEKSIKPGKGLVGQCYLEGELIYLKEVPQEFVNITSGLGDARPDSILIVPLKLNDRIEGVIELASLKPFEDHQIEFLLKLGESLASAISTVKNADNTRQLLEQTQQQSEEMRAQEEEMRQNMEELQATQEQMHRKNEEVEELLKKASDREKEMKKQNETIEREKEELETEKSILNTLMDLLPERITIKDDRGKYLRISEAKYKTLRAQGLNHLIGKSDEDIFGAEHFRKSYAVERDLMNSKKPVLDVEERIKISDDLSIWGLTSRVPFVDTSGNILGTIAITRDITKEKECEEELKKLKKGK